MTLAMHLRPIVAGATLLAMLVFVASSTAGSGSAGPLPRAGADDVQTASNEFRKGDRVKTVPIARNAWQGSRSIMSLSPKDVGTLTPGRRLKVSADAEVTVCTKPQGGHSGTPCVGRTYDYDPYVRMKIVAGPSPGSVGGVEHRRPDRRQVADLLPASAEPQPPLRARHPLERHRHSLHRSASVCAEQLLRQPRAGGRSLLLPGRRCGRRRLQRRQQEDPPGTHPAQLGPLHRQRQAGPHLSARLARTRGS